MFTPTVLNAGDTGYCIHIIASPNDGVKLGEIVIYLGDDDEARREIFWRQAVPAAGKEWQVPLEGKEWLKLWQPFNEKIGGVDNLRSTKLFCERTAPATGPENMNLTMRFFQEE